VKIIRTGFIVGVSMLVLTGLTACQSQTGEGETKIVRVAFNQNETHPEYIAMEEFGQKFKEATHGRYEVQIYPNAVMGDQGPVTELVRTGALQMAMVPVAVPEAYNRDFAIISAPYLYDNIEQMREAAKAGVFDELYETTKKYNFEIVTLYTSGARHIYTNKPIETPEDLKGYKIRVMDSDAYIRMAGLMGGVGTPMSQGEVYTAIQQKVIEGGENSEVVYDNFKHYEIAPYFSYTNHLVMADVVVANEDFLTDMDQETREIFDRLMEESMLREFELWNSSVEEPIEKVKNEGVTFVYPDIELFRERCMPLLLEIADQSEMTRKIYDDVERIKVEMGEETDG